MAKLFKSFTNRIYYALASVKNRYPCKIISIRKIKNSPNETALLYRAVTKYNIREATPEEIINDPVLVEKFHPTDGVRLGSLAMGQILLREGLNIDDARNLYEKIINHMFDDEEKK